MFEEAFAVKCLEDGLTIQLKLEWISFAVCCRKDPEIKEESR